MPLRKVSVAFGKTTAGIPLSARLTGGMGENSTHFDDEPGGHAQERGESEVGRASHDDLVSVQVLQRRGAVRAVIEANHTDHRTGRHGSPGQPLFRGEIMRRTDLVQTRAEYHSREAILTHHAGGQAVFPAAPGDALFQLADGCRAVRNFLWRNKMSSCCQSRARFSCNRSDRITAYSAA